MRLYYDHIVELKTVLARALVPPLKPRRDEAVRRCSPSVMRAT